MFRRRFGGFPYPKADIGDQPAFGPGTANVPASEYQFGTHSAQLYNDSLRSQTWRSVAAAAITTAVAAYVYAPAQAYADIQPVYSRPVSQGQTPPVVPRQYAGPQPWDVPPPSYEAPVNGPPSVSDNRHFAGPQNPDIPPPVSIQPWHGPQGPVPPYLYAQLAPDIEGSATYTSPSLAQAIVQTVRGYTVNPQQIDFPQSAIYPSVAAAYGILIPWHVSEPQEYRDAPSFTWATATAAAPAPSIPSQWTPPQFADVQQPTIVRSRPAPLIFGPTVTSYVVPLQADTSLNYSVTMTLVPVSTPAGPVAPGPPLQINLSLSGIRLGGNTF